MIYAFITPSIHGKAAPTMVSRRHFLSASASASLIALSRPSFAVRPDAKKSSGVPIIDVTDLYHPFQDPGDSVDLVHGFALPGVDLRAIVLDATAEFRRKLANHPNMWQDPNGPREPGIVPVMQINNVFGKSVPFGVGPFRAMRSLDDRLQDAPGFQQSGIQLILDVLRQSEERVEILSFGSARTIAAALNRNPELLKQKVARIHLSAGSALDNFELGSSADHNEMPGGEWNVALDPYAFIRLLRSDLPIAIYPCATRDGAFDYGPHNTYWKLPDLEFLRHLNLPLRNYLMYALGRMNRPDFLSCLGDKLDTTDAEDRLTHKHHVWETAIWLNVAKMALVRRANGAYRIVPRTEVVATDRVIKNELRPCTVTVRDDARFKFSFTTGKTNFSIFERDDPAEYEKASREALPELWKNFAGLVPAEDL